MRLLMLIIFIYTVSFSEVLAQKYTIRRFDEYEHSPYFDYTDEEKASLQKQLSEDKSPRGDSIFNAYYPFVFLNDSLSEAATHLVEPCLESPFYEQDDSGIFRLKGNCGADTICISDTLHLWLRFILFESQMVNSYGFGPNAVVRTGNSYLSLNFTQLIAAISWYKLNKSLLSKYAFFLFSGSRSGDQWIEPAISRAFTNQDVLNTELPDELVNDLYFSDAEIYEKVLLHSNSISKFFNIYSLPKDDGVTYWKFHFSFFSNMGHNYY